MNYKLVSVSIDSVFPSIIKTPKFVADMGYHFLRRLSDDASSTVVYWSERAGEYYAVKMISLEGDRAAKFDLYNRERDALISLKGGPHIVSLVDHGVSSDFKFAYIITPYIGDDLWTIMASDNFDPIPEDRVKKWAYQLVRAVQFSHQKGFALLDIAPENIVLDDRDDCITLIDFGLSKRMTESGFTGVNGRYQYLAPEVISADQHNKQLFQLAEKYPVVYSVLSGDFCQKTYSCVVDFWAVGCIVYELLTGFQLNPVSEESPFGLVLTSLLIDSSIEKSMEICSQEAQAFVRQLLVFDPISRYKNSIRLLAHPFFQAKPTQVVVA